MKRNPVNEKLTAALIAELGNETDDGLALRRALIHCALLTGESRDPAIRAFTDFLLLDFRPLAGEFADDKHPYLGAFEAMRGRMQNGRLGVVLPLARVRAWLARE